MGDWPRAHELRFPSQLPRWACLLGQVRLNRLAHSEAKNKNGKTEGSKKLERKSTWGLSLKYLREPEAWYFRDFSQQIEEIKTTLFLHQVFGSWKYKTPTEPRYLAKDGLLDKSLQILTQ